MLGPPISEAADYWGRKYLVIVLGLCGVVGCIIGSRANSIGMMFAAQAIASLSMASQPLLHAITSEIIARQYRPLAQIFNNIAAGFGGVVGLLVGGALTLNNVQGWRTYWYIAAGIYACSAIGITLLYHPRTRPLQAGLSAVEKIRRLDWISYILLLVGLSLFCTALSWSQNPYQWSNAHIIIPFVLGVIFMIILAIYSRFIKKGWLVPSRIILNQQEFRYRAGRYLCRRCFFLRQQQLLFVPDDGALRRESIPSWPSLRRRILVVHFLHNLRRHILFQGQEHPFPFVSGVRLLHCVPPS